MLALPGCNSTGYLCFERGRGCACMYVLPKLPLAFVDRRCANRYNEKSYQLSRLSRYFSTYRECLELVLEVL
jgi:hypothetical protein